MPSTLALVLQFKSNEEVSTATQWLIWTLAQPLAVGYAVRHSGLELRPAEPSVSLAALGD
ncbi:MAG: hypothetical protein IPG23_12400 [Burkholderiales bacterium]|nr:hypothetical protein [Burkholderiales bacterium]